MTRRHAVRIVRGRRRTGRRGTPARWLQAASRRQRDIDPASLMTTPVLLMQSGRTVSQGTGFLFGEHDRRRHDRDRLPRHQLPRRHRPRAAVDQSARGRSDPDSCSTAARRTSAMFARSNCPCTTRRTGRSGSRARPIRRPTSCSSRCQPASTRALSPLVFTEAHTRGDIRIRPTSGATLLGYPYGFYDQKHFLPVWKTGHVASEPSVDFEGRPVFLVDVSAFPGHVGIPGAGGGERPLRNGRRVHAVRADLEAARHFLGDARRPRAAAGWMPPGFRATPGRRSRPRCSSGTSGRRA